MYNTRRIICGFLVGIAWTGFSSFAIAADYPSRPVTLIVPTGAGGGTDLVARTISSRFSQALGQPVVVVNRAGAGGIIGNQDAATAKPDGYTLLVSSNQFAMIPAVHKSLPYDPVKDFIPITSIGMIPTLVVVNPEVPVNSLAELIAFAKHNPGKLKYASAGVGSPNHLFGALLNKMAKIDTMHVPYRGAAAALMGVASGDASMAYASLPASQSFLASKKIKPLAVTSATRISGFPDLPAVAEMIPGYDAEIWLGVWGIANTPPAIIQRVHKALVTTMNDPDVKKGLSKLGLVIKPRGQKEFEAMVNHELSTWATVVNESGGAIARQ